MWVVKLGGSLLKTPHLQDWLQLLSLQHSIPLLILTGGGPFADTVRNIQKATQIDDAAAHDMAICAMEQNAWLCHALQPELKIADSVEQITALHADGKNVIFLPGRNLEEEAHLNKNWSMTSDSIAAHLASKWQAQRLILVKSCDLIQSDNYGTELMQAGIVDEMFPSIMRNFDGNLVCYTAAQVHKFASDLAILAEGKIGVVS